MASVPVCSDVIGVSFSKDRFRRVVFSNLNLPHDEHPSALLWWFLTSPLRVVWACDRKFLRDIMTYDASSDVTCMSICMDRVPHAGTELNYSTYDCHPFLKKACCRQQSQHYEYSKFNARVPTCTSHVASAAHRAEHCSIARRTYQSGLACVMLL